MTFTTKQTVICLYFKIFISRFTVHVLLTDIQFFFKPLSYSGYIINIFQGCDRSRGGWKGEGGKGEQEEGREGGAGMQQEQLYLHF